MVLSGSNAYLLPDENAGHFVYADTRIADPRYARSAEDLVCVLDKGPIVYPPMNNAPREKGKGGPTGSQLIPIGCCPAGDPTGKPYGPGKNCCCGQVYDDDSQMCCDYSCKVYPNTLQGITKCNMDAVEVTTPAAEWHDDTKTIAEPTHNPPYWIPDPPKTSEDPNQPEVVENGKCPKAWYVPSPMEASCTDYNNEGSFCAFSCPSNLKVRIPDDPNRVCHNQEWMGQVPQCCERDGCPSDLRVDFFFILDSSSSIKDKNFQYVREYVIGLISTMPVGLDKTRVGILTYNNDVVHRVRLNQFDKKSALMDAVNKIPYEGRGTKTNSALEYAVNEALTLENGDRPDVPNFVLVLTDGRATDDVRIGAPLLRQKAAVIAVGVGKRIEKKELEYIAGDKGNVFMVADFRNLPGSNSEGKKDCANAQISAQIQIEEAEAAKMSGQMPAQISRKRRDDEIQGEADSIADEMAALEKDLEALHERFTAGSIVDSTYYSELRRFTQLRKHLVEKSKGDHIVSEKISGDTNKPSKSKKPLSNDFDAICPNLNANGLPKTQTVEKDPLGGDLGRSSASNTGDGLRFTTSFICPKSCIWEEYVLYYPDNVLKMP